MKRYSIMMMKPVQNAGISRPNLMTTVTTTETNMGKAYEKFCRSARKSFELTKTGEQFRFYKKKDFNRFLRIVYKTVLGEDGILRK